MQTNFSDLPDAPGTVPARNHPLALRMGVIAFINQNLSVGCIYGTFSVLMAAVDAHLGVGPKQSAWGVPLINLAVAIIAPLSGALVLRHSLRLMMLVGSILGLLGFLVLATTTSYPLYLLAYGLGLGPAMASVGVVLPATLVTRWFAVHRGRALGLMTVPLAIIFMPLSSTWLVRTYGLQPTYWALASVYAICVIANFFIIDRPPDTLPVTVGTLAGRGAPLAQQRSGLLSMRSARFWMVAVAAVAPNTGAVILVANIVSIAGAWGLTPTQGASLLSLQTLAGLAGSLVFGWLADKLGGVRTLALLVFNSAVLWMLLLLHPPYIAVAAIFIVFGVHGSGALPVTGALISELVGREGFSRAYGIFNLVNLPFSFFCIPAAAAVFERTGSYDRALWAQVVFYFLAIPLVLTGWRRQTAQAIPDSAP